MMRITELIRKIGSMRLILTGRHKGRSLAGMCGSGRILFLRMGKMKRMSILRREGRGVRGCRA